MSGKKDDDEFKPWYMQDPTDERGAEVGWNALLRLYFWITIILYWMGTFDCPPCN